MTGSPATNLAAIPFENDIKRLTKNFSGREWVFKDIDDWLTKKGNRFFLLTGEPGVGKSAIAAQLIQIRQYIIPTCVLKRNSQMREVSHRF